MAFLKGTSGTTKGIFFELTRDETTIGRHGSNMLVIQDPSISAFHCAIERANGHYTIRDLDSTNGTKVNGKPVTLQSIFSGNSLHVGNVELIIEGDDIVPAEENGPAAVQPTARPSAAVAATARASSRPTPQFNTIRRDTAKATLLSLGAVALVSTVLVIISLYSIFRLT